MVKSKNNSVELNTTTPATEKTVDVSNLTKEVNEAPAERKAHERFALFLYPVNQSMPENVIKIMGEKGVYGTHGSAWADDAGRIENNGKEGLQPFALGEDYRMVDEVHVSPFSQVYLVTDNNLVVMIPKQEGFNQDDIIKMHEAGKHLWVRPTEWLISNPSYNDPSTDYVDSFDMNGVPMPMSDGSAGYQHTGYNQFGFGGGLVNNNPSLIRSGGSYAKPISLQDSHPDGIAWKRTPPAEDGMRIFVGHCVCTATAFDNTFISNSAIQPRIVGGVNEEVNKVLDDGTVELVTGEIIKGSKAAFIALRSSLRCSGPSVRVFVTVIEI